MSDILESEITGSTLVIAAFSIRDDDNADKLEDGNSIREKLPGLYENTKFIPAYHLKPSEEIVSRKTRIAAIHLNKLFGNKGYSYRDKEVPFIFIPSATLVKLREGLSDTMLESITTLEKRVSRLKSTLECGKAVGNYDLELIKNTLISSRETRIIIDDGEPLFLTDWLLRRSPEELSDGLYVYGLYLMYDI